MPVCAEREPQLIEVGQGRSVSCHLHDPEVVSGTAA
jgi:hypothetical protein